ncbi:MAG: ribbon-helix-helix domain-containing protein [Spirulinaceae cyanobacterium]
MQITLNSEQVQFIQSQIKTGKYQNPEQIINDALLWFKNHGRIEALREEIEIGTADIAAGRITDGEAVFAQLKARLHNEFGLEE